VPLSEHEQRQFDAIERALYADDPKFANKLRVTDPRLSGKRVFFSGIAIVVLGVGVLVAGAIIANWYVGLFGFLVMLAGATRAYAGFRRWVVPAGEEVDQPIPLRRRRFGRARRDRRSRASNVPHRVTFREVMENRWRRRMGDY
jgi:hypothetical protein